MRIGRTGIRRQGAARGAAGAALAGSRGGARGAAGRSRAAGQLLSGVVGAALLDLVH